MGAGFAECFNEGKNYEKNEKKTYEKNEIKPIVQDSPRNFFGEGLICLKCLKDGLIPTEETFFKKENLDELFRKYPPLNDSNVKLKIIKKKIDGFGGFESIKIYYFGEATKFFFSERPHGRGIKSTNFLFFSEGYFKDGELDGKGKTVVLNEEMFEGNFKYGKREGFGIKYYKNGDRFEGYYKKNDEYEGKIIHPDESVAGIYKGGRFIDYEK